MIERMGHIHFFPAGRRVAGFARSLERPLVRVAVACGACVKLDPHELHRFIRPGREVTFAASDLGVHPRQGIFCFRVIELLRLFPVGYIVAALTIGSQLPLVRIAVARDAVFRKAQKGFAEVLALNQRAFGGNHVRGRVTFFTGHSGVLLKQRIACLPVIELLQ